MDQGESVSVTVVDRVADHHGVDPMTLEPRLHTVVDPDALDALVRDAAESMSVQFTYGGCAVTVDGDGTVDVRPAPTSPDPERTATGNSLGY